MLKKNPKTRCEKKQMKKATTICRFYSKLQSKYADTLEANDEVVEYTCNVLIDSEIGEYTTDFLFKKVDGTFSVRECVERKKLLWPSVAKLLDASRVYWMSRGIEDWGIVIDKQKEEGEADKKENY